ncbi:MAG: hypothetical protein A3I66_01800 [Burkholderiales bacterium RIFCSPLOWO2_02_FULL_57_36]|nr:MAG: hypothetical protein A3I66_01800 [Burkholderiales bacterium RIFCSPLOWO2_02_FULL_57_36]
MDCVKKGIGPARQVSQMVAALLSLHCRHLKSGTAIKRPLSPLQQKTKIGAITDVHQFECKGTRIFHSA